MNIIKKRWWRLLIISDMHCGNIVGLTPPSFQRKFLPKDISKCNKLTKIQKAIWNYYSNEITKINKEKQIDICISNGDAISGNGYRSGGTEELTTDRIIQADIAQKAIEFVGAKTNLIIAGTPSHVGTEEEYEQVLANNLNCKFENHSWVEINKIIFDLKHHCNSSGVPHGRFTPIAKEALWGKLWGEIDLIPKPIHYLIRSHVHYFSLIQDDHITALTTPCLQGFGSRYGAKLCSGIPTIGFLTFDIYPNGQTNMQKHFVNLLEQKAKPIIFE
jgi:hypothetical protein